MICERDPLLKKLWLTQSLLRQPVSVRIQHVDQIWTRETRATTTSLQGPTNDPPSRNAVEHKGSQKQIVPPTARRIHHRGVLPSDER